MDFPPQPTAPTACGTRSVPVGPWWVPADGGWRRTDDRAEAHRTAVAPYADGQGCGGEETAATIHRPPLSSLYRFLRGVVLRNWRAAIASCLWGWPRACSGLFVSTLASYPRVSTALAHLPITAMASQYVRLGRNGMARPPAGRSMAGDAGSERPKPDTVVAGRLVSAVDDDVIERASGHYRVSARRIGQVGLGLADAAETRRHGAADSLHSPPRSVARPTGCWPRPPGPPGSRVLRWVRNAHAPVKSRLCVGSGVCYFHAQLPRKGWWTATVLVAVGRGAGAPGAAVRAAFRHRSFWRGYVRRRPRRRRGVKRHFSCRHLRRLVVSAQFHFPDRGRTDYRGPEVS